MNALSHWPDRGCGEARQAARSHPSLPPAHPSFAKVLRRLSEVLTYSPKDAVAFCRNQAAVYERALANPSEQALDRMLERGYSVFDLDEFSTWLHRRADELAAGRDT